MLCKLLASTFIFLYLPGIGDHAVSIEIPQGRFQARETVGAVVKNDGAIPVTFCVEFGQTSLASPYHKPEHTPIPFIVQRYSSGKWDTVLIGPDVGSVRDRVILEPGKSIAYSFRFNANGKVCLRLIYWLGALNDLDCKHPPRRPRTVESESFEIGEPR